MNITDLLPPNLDLPIIWRNILSNLDLKDIENCRLVNKAFETEISRQMKSEMLYKMADKETYETKEFETSVVREEIEIGDAKKMSLHLDINFREIKAKKTFYCSRILMAGRYLIVLAQNGNAIINRKYRINDKVFVLKFSMSGQFLESVKIDNIQRDYAVRIGGNFLIAQQKDNNYRVFNLHNFNVNGDTDGRYKFVENQMHNFKINNLANEREEKYFHYDNSCVAAIIRNKVYHLIEFHFFNDVNVGFEYRGSLTVHDLFRDRIIDMNEWISNWKMFSPDKVDDKLICRFYKEKDDEYHKRCLLTFISLPNLSITNSFYQGPILHLMPKDENHEEYDGMFFHCRLSVKTRFISGEGKLLYDFLPNSIPDFMDFPNWDGIVPGPNSVVMFMDWCANDDYQPSPKRVRVADSLEERTSTFKREIKLIYIDLLEKNTAVKKIVIELDAEDEDISLSLSDAVIYEGQLIFKFTGDENRNENGNNRDKEWIDEGRFAFSCDLDPQSNEWKAEKCPSIENLEEIFLMPKHGILAKDLNGKGYRCIFNKFTKGYLKR